MSRGNGQQKIIRDECEYGRFLQGFETIVDEFGFELFSSACMPNHVHLFFMTPAPTSRKEGTICTPNTPIGSTRVIVNPSTGAGGD
jgi:REP element-mobilizing transposase RayT